MLVTTEHFRVYSDLDAGDVEALAVGLERDLALVAQAAFQSPNLVVAPTDVVVFSQHAHFHRYFPESSGGLFYPRLPLLPESQSTVVTFEKLSASMQTTLRHELVHDVYARNFGAAPPWLDEGFAQYFSTVELAQGVIRVGAALPGVAMTGASQPFVAEEDGASVLAIPRAMIPAPSALLAMSDDEFYARGDVPDGELGTSPERLARYLGAWVFVHYLMGQNGDASHRFQRFLSIVRTTSVARAWEEAFAGVDTRKLDEDFRSYLASGRLGLSAVRYREPTQSPSRKVRALGDGEKHVLLAKLVLALRLTAAEMPVFAKELDLALHSDPRPPEAYYLRGMVAWSQGKTTEAERDFESALRLAPNAPLILRASLDLRLEQQGGQFGAQELMEFRVAVEKLESLSTSASELLFIAQFYAQVGEEERALTLGSRAVTKSPVDPFVLSQYARVLESCRRLEHAITIQRRALSFLHEHRALQERFQSELERMESLLTQQRASGPALP